MKFWQYSSWKAVSGFPDWYQVQQQRKAHHIGQHAVIIDSKAGGRSYPGSAPQLNGIQGIGALDWQHALVTPHSASRSSFWDDLSYWINRPFDNLLWDNIPWYKRLWDNLPWDALWDNLWDDYLPRVEQHPLG